MGARGPDAEECCHEIRVRYLHICSRKHPQLASCHAKIVGHASRAVHTAKLMAVGVLYDCRRVCDDDAACLMRAFDCFAKLKRFRNHVPAEPCQVLSSSLDSLSQKRCEPIGNDTHDGVHPICSCSASCGGHV